MFLIKLPCSPTASFWQFHLQTKILLPLTQLKFPVKLIHLVTILQTIHFPAKIPDALCGHVILFVIFTAERTFGVLTKIDLMDKGTDAVEVSCVTLINAIL